ncbi:4-oxalocrotonate tautomerase family enzyme [Micromonospora sp. Llam0]|uniref:tautomerase family protein n=1 Tax=Micromonospora sp. Llam0 TaxID=2485143 RepID=UPI000F4906C6|nr:tautomerase family protein [Micromonospora sp. Llam0]ROO59761.1 4-oxalocrotonate tautomerase family enzyme [Micromonospora sp. Llam0]
MPFIDVRIFEERLTPAVQEALVTRLSDAVGDVLGADARAQTWVVLTGAPADRWGIGGVPARPPAPAADDAGDRDTDGRDTGSQPMDSEGPER